MIKVGDVLESFNGLIDCGVEARGKLVTDIYKLTKKWINNRILINEYELDMYEEEIATRLTKILGKRKEK